uniref:NAD(+) ADP-ribosyltransferase n=1 Tax=Caenorhabditis japonica TaxID=281687 RepID=A0A8R1HTH5_CAEJA
MNNADWLLATALTKVVDALLLAGCDPNAADANGTTPVHEAAMAGHEITFIALLEKGGSLEQKNVKGENASHLACDNNKILQVIQEHRAETAKQSAPMGGSRGPRTLSELLEEMDLARYTEQFKHENVDLEVFFELKEQDFVDMKIAYGPKKRMLDVIKRYRATGVIRTDAFDAPQAAASTSPRGYSNHSGEDNEKVSATLRAIKDLNQESKQFAMDALELLGSGDTDKIHTQLINIINNAESISLRVSSHV